MKLIQRILLVKHWWNFQKGFSREVRSVGLLYREPNGGRVGVDGAHFCRRCPGRTQGLEEICSWPLVEEILQLQAKLCPISALLVFTALHAPDVDARVAPQSYGGVVPKSELSWG